MSKSKPNLNRDRALALAYSRGLLSYKLYDYQRVLYDDLWSGINNPDCLKYVLNVSRRWGKSTVLSLIAIEYALRHPNSQIRFAAPTAKMLKKITNPIFRMLLADAPAEFKPRYHVQDNMWKFHNGSEIHCAGTDSGNAENLRGTASNLNLIDEAGFADSLLYVLDSILTPQTLTTGGKTLIASTPPTSPSHDFVSIAEECRMRGFYKTYTIYDNKSLDADTIALYAKEAGGYDSTTWKREYLAMFVSDSSLQIIPEWDDVHIKECKADDLNQFYHKYVAMDLGVKDFTAVIFGTYNFKEATLYIQDEITMDGPSMTTVLLKDAIVNKEAELWTGTNKAYRRISDNNNLMLLQDLGHLHQLHFNATNKDTLEAMVNEVRMFVAQGRLKVSPKCKMLLGCLNSGIWDNNHKMFARSTVYKHFDHLASLIYLIRNLDQVSNPVPATYNISNNTHWIPQDINKTSNQVAMAKLFGRKNQ